MTEPRRFSDDVDPTLALLVRAGQKEVPPRRALDKTLAGLGAATTVIGASHTAAAAATAGKLGLWTLVKWAGAGMLGGMVTIGGVELVQDALTSSPRLTSSPHATAEAALPARAGAPESPRAAQPPGVPPSVPSPADLATPPSAIFASEAARARGALPQAQPSHSVRVPVAASTGIAESKPRRAAPTKRPALVRPGADAPEVDAAIAVEVALIDEARRALRAGRPDSALRALHRYRAEVQRPRLLPEAQYLEMEAFVASGDGAAARRTAGEVLERYPRGPHAARAQSVLVGAPAEQR